jgi:hypothetical protein
MRRACLQIVKDHVADALRIAPQIRIPKPQRLDAARFQKLFPRRVVFPLENDREAGKFVLTPALTFYPLPRGEEMAVVRFWFCG